MSEVHPRYEHAIRHTLHKAGPEFAIIQAKGVCGMTDQEARAYIAQLQRSKPIPTDDVIRQYWRREHRKPWQQGD